MPKTIGSVGSMPLQFLEIGFHVEIHAIEWHDFQHETQFHGSCSGMNRIFSLIKYDQLKMLTAINPSLS